VTKIIRPRVGATTLTMMTLTIMTFTILMEKIFHKIRGKIFQNINGKNISKY
jgi:hypothetical protein